MQILKSKINSGYWNFNSSDYRCFNIQYSILFTMVEAKDWESSFWDSGTNSFFAFISKGVTFITHKWLDALNCKNQTMSLLQFACLKVGKFPLSYESNQQKLTVHFFRFESSVRNRFRWKGFFDKVKFYFQFSLMKRVLSGLSLLSPKFVNLTGLVEKIGDGCLGSRWFKSGTQLAHNVVVTSI